MEVESVIKSCEKFGMKRGEDWARARRGEGLLGFCSLLFISMREINW